MKWLSQERSRTHEGPIAILVDPISISPHGGVATLFWMKSAAGQRNRTSTLSTGWMDLLSGKCTTAWVSNHREAFQGWATRGFFLLLREPDRLSSDRSHTHSPTCGQVPQAPGHRFIVESDGAGCRRADARPSEEFKERRRGLLRLAGVRRKRRIVLFLWS